SRSVRWTNWRIHVGDLTVLFVNDAAKEATRFAKGEPMSSPAYQAMAFLEDATDFSLAEAQTRLAKPFAGATITSRGSRLDISIKGWRLSLNFADAPHVFEEAKDIAKHFSKCPKAPAIAKCRRRVELWSEDDDPDMIHINDFIFACEVLSSFKGVILL